MYLQNCLLEAYFIRFVWGKLFPSETKIGPDLRLCVDGRRIRIGGNTISPFNQKWMHIFYYKGLKRSLSRPYISQRRLKHGVPSHNPKRSTPK